MSVPPDLWRLLDSYNAPLKEIHTSFLRIFGKEDFSRVAVSLTILMEDGNLNMLPRLIIAYFLFYIIGVTESSISNNPNITALKFLFSLLDEGHNQPIQHESVRNDHVRFLNILRILVASLLTGSGGELIEQSPRALATSLLAPIDKQRGVLARLQQSLQAQNYVLELRKTAYQRIIPSLGGNHSPALLSPFLYGPQPSIDNENTSYPQEQDYGRFGLIGLRPAPSVMPILDIEGWWTMPNSSTHSPILMQPELPTQKNHSSSEQLNILLQHATKHRLKQSEEQSLLDALKSEPELAFECGVGGKKLRGLVESNPRIAAEVGIRQSGDELLQVLSKMDVSLHSLDVVNRLANNTQLPKDFLRSFISSCISACTHAQGTRQTRLVRIVSVFVQSLIRNRVVENEDLFEVSSFCMRFSNVAEATELYKSLKNI
eukprot:gb/GECH01000201.1/.p1 GENE.gb/GECH01000201.1/~~gb/GECH01000201.1/.p1  ORF type:complete len:431 (+),score=77.98 gb/GECH01000201.1/:1-1293(+)